MKMVVMRVGFLLLAGGMALGAAAADWSRYRGPNGSGVTDATGLPGMVAARWD